MRQQATTVAFADGKVTCANCEKPLDDDGASEVQWVHHMGEDKPRAVIVTCRHCHTINEITFAGTR